MRKVENIKQKDNNSAPDSRLVGPGRSGKMIASVPKLGMLTILLRTENKGWESEVEF